MVLINGDCWLIVVRLIHIIIVFVVVEPLRQIVVVSQEDVNVYKAL